MFDSMKADFDPIPKLPEQLTPYLKVLGEPPRLPICLWCQTAILPRSLSDHLRKNHQVPPELRDSIKSLVATLPEMDFSDIPPRPDGSPIMDELRLIDAFQCKQCPFIRRDLTDVRKHINKEHGITAAGNYEEIQAQSWFGGRRAVYWKVCEGENEVLRGPPCVWGFFGTGWGDKAPKEWPNDREREDKILEHRSCLKKQGSEENEGS